MIKIACPGCSSRFNAPLHADGKKTRCPLCKTSFVVSIPVATISPAEPELHVTATPPSPPPQVYAPPVAPPPAARFDLEDDPNAREVIEAPSRPRRRSYYSEYSEPRRSNSFGVASLVVGVLSLFVCWIPAVGLIVSGLGVLLGLTGLLVAMTRSGSGAGFCVGGTILSTLAVIPSLAFIGFIAATPAKPGSRPVPIFAQPEGQPAAKGTAIDEWVSVGDVRIKVANVTAGQVELKDTFGPATSKDRLLAVHVVVENLSATKLAVFRGWGAERALFLERSAALHDEIGNRYILQRFTIGARPVGQTLISDIYPGKRATDVIIFNVPVDAAQTLTLELNAANIGGTGMITFELPTKSIEQKWGRKMPRAPESFRSRIDAKSKILQDEFYDHLAEVQIELPEADQRTVYEGWARLAGRMSGRRHDRHT